MRWPGPFSVIARPVSRDVSGNLGTRSYSLADLPWDFHLDETRDAVLDLRPDVVQIPLHLSERAVLTQVPCVVAAENSARERLRFAASTAPRHRLPRMAAGAVRQAWVLRQMVQRAAGLACNGWAAWDAYSGGSGRHRVEPLLYFDTRLTANRVERAAERLALSPARPSLLRLAFSGRLHPAKGGHYAVAASAELERRGVTHSLTMLGTGPDLDRLRAAAGQSVTWAGELEFEPDWVDFVSTSVDLMVLPHTQGDPSGTYLEAAGLGVPVVGFDNAALRGHAERAGFAVASSRWSADTLADLISTLAVDDAERRRLASAGIDFMRGHAFELTFDARVGQLLEVAGASR